MHTVDLTGKTDDEIITIITNAGRTAEQWDAAKNDLGLKKSISEVRYKASKQLLKKRFNKPTTFKQPFHKKTGFQQRNFKMKKSNETYAEQVDGIDKSDLARRKASGECQRCALPVDRKGSHKTMDCFRWSRKDKGTAPFPKPMEYEKLKVGAYNQEESEMDLFMTDEEENSDEESDSEIEDQKEEDLFEDQEDKDQDNEEATESEDRLERN